MPFGAEGIFAYGMGWGGMYWGRGVPVLAACMAASRSGCIRGAVGGADGVGMEGGIVMGVESGGGWVVY